MRVVFVSTSSCHMLVVAASSAVSIVARAGLASVATGRGVSIPSAARPRLGPDRYRGVVSERASPTRRASHASLSSRRTGDLSAFTTMATVNAATVPSADDDALFLGLDFGTSGARATVVGPDGVILCETTAKYPPIVNGGKAGDGIPEGGWAEAWRGALWSLLDQLDETTVRSRIAAVSIDGTSGTVIIVDAASGEPIYPPMLYNEKRNDAMDAVCAMAPTGHTVRTPSSALCKLHSWWLGNGETIGNAKLLHHADWIAFLLHGLQGETDHNNALKLGFDPGLGPHGDYPAWMKSLPYASMLPSNVRAPGTKTGAVATTAAMKYFTRPGGCAVIAGTTDSIAAFVAARCTDVGDAVTSLGSSLALKLVSETRVDDSAKGVYSHRLCGESIFSILVRAIILTSSVLFTGSWLVGGSSNLGGWLLRSNFSDDELVELTDLIDLNDAAKEKDVPDYYPGVLMGFGMTVKEATEALCPRPESDSDYLRGEFLFISVWAIVMTSCFIYSHPGLRRGRRGALVRGDGRHGLVEGGEGVHRGRGC
jgi:sugar (pentulose or hexulose) kinase